MRGLCEFIKRRTGSSEEIPGDPQELMDSLPLWLATASAWARKRKTRFVFVLDALNSLTDQQDLRWWPAFLPQGVYFVVSCLPGPVLQALKDKADSPFRVPPGIKLISIDPKSGLRSSGAGAILEAFKPGTAPPDSYSVIGGGGAGARGSAARDADRAVGSGTGGLY